VTAGRTGFSKLDAHGKEAVNFLISMLISAAVAADSSFPD
jgi:uncharacterized Tic20 family protein